MKTCLFTCFVLISLNSMADQDFITVGADNNCHFSSIQSAIDSGLSGEIRIASSGSPYFEHLSMHDVSRTLKGGYADCSAAAANITDLSHPVIDGANSGIVLSISGKGTGNKVELRHLYIGNGDQGIDVNEAKVNLVIDDVLIYNNNLRGMVVFKGNADIVINDSTISYNGDTGVTCFAEDNNTSISLVGDTLIEHNKASKFGGGMRIYGCNAYVYSPVVIQKNTTGGIGGGISLERGARLWLFGGFSHCENGICYGDNNQPVMIRDNTARAYQDGPYSGVGGGFFATGNGTKVFAVNTVFDDNLAVHGGAFYVTSSVEFMALSYENQGAGCWSVEQCSRFVNNKARRGGLGYVNGGAVVRLYRSWIQGHRANMGVLGYLVDNAEMTFNNSMLVENGDWGSDGDYIDQELFFVDEFDLNPDVTANLRLESVTIADNRVVEELIDNHRGDVNVLSSIIVDESVDVYSEAEGSNSHFECVLSHESDSFSAGGTVMVGDPQFVNLGANDYRLQATSPAIDYCYEISFDVMEDMEFEAHGVDDPNHPNLHGTYDLGADEYNNP